MKTKKPKQKKLKNKKVLRKTPRSTIVIKQQEEDEEVFQKDIRGQNIFFKR